MMVGTLVLVLVLVPFSLMTRVSSVSFLVLPGQLYVFFGEVSLHILYLCSDSKAVLSCVFLGSVISPIAAEKQLCQRCLCRLTLNIISSS
jgi:hypothetical protein